jgi:hypothetical protein
MTPDRFARLQHAILIERSEYRMAGFDIVDILDTPEKRAMVALFHIKRESALERYEANKVRRRLARAQRRLTLNSERDMAHERRGRYAAA